MAIYVRRRELIAALGGAAAWPFAARAQEPGRIYRIGILAGSGRDTPRMLALFDELRRFGFIEGQNLSLVPGGFDVPNEQYAERAAAIVKVAPDVILTIGEPATRAAQQATRSVPIVGAAEDMVAAGLVNSLSHPGGNITGISLLSPELDGKRQDILLEAVPDARRIAALADSTNAIPEQHLEMLRVAARARGVELAVFSAGKPEEIAPAISNAKAWGAAALNQLASSMLVTNGRIMYVSAAAARLPTIYQWAEMAEEGGFAAYGSRVVQMYRERARMVVKILRGAKPADLPIEQPTHFELIINLKTAKAIGHEVPAGLVLRADKVIE